LRWSFAPVSEILVTNTADEFGTISTTSLREALYQAGAGSRVGRVRFDPSVFPPGSPKTIRVRSISGMLYADGTNVPVVVDGLGADVIVSPDPSVLLSEKYLLSMYGRVTVSHLTFAGAGDLYPNDGTTPTNNCGGGST